MIRITQLKLPIEHTKEDILSKSARMLGISEDQIVTFKVIKRSVDARKKDDICYKYTVDLSTGNDEKIVKKARDKRVTITEEAVYLFPVCRTVKPDRPPVIIGSGPAGLFCGYFLAEAGLCPIILERGSDVDSRRKIVDEFWDTGKLDLRTNVQFGEGGAGTFSDGKLNTLNKDASGRGDMVLKIMAEHGADSDILFEGRPHIGTDVLGIVIKNIREHIIDMGGEVRFDSQVTDILIRNGAVKGVEVNGDDPLRRYEIVADTVVLAIGHSARDTFTMLRSRQINMEPKAFAVGLRIQHPQKMINLSQYGMEDTEKLGPAPYKLTYRCDNGRGVYSFCMCPGGYVVDASSEEGRLAVNGMSYHGREGANANAALIVTVTPDDFPDRSPLGGVEYQRRLEEAAFKAGKGKIPIQLYGDFKAGRISRDLGDVMPQFKGRYEFADLNDILPGYVAESIKEGIEEFDLKIHGFSRYDAILAGIESRTSSPVRILRDENFESSLKGLFPCGEGAGYAGDIMSAAIDGIKTAEKTALRYLTNNTV